MRNWIGFIALMVCLDLASVASLSSPSASPRNYGRERPANPLTIYLTPQYVATGLLSAEADTTFEVRVESNGSYGGRGGSSGNRYFSSGSSGGTSGGNRHRPVVAPGRPSSSANQPAPAYGGPLLAATSTSRPPVVTTSTRRPSSVSTTSRRPLVVTTTTRRPPSTSSSRRPVVSTSSRRPPVVSTSSRRPPVVSTSSRRPPTTVTSSSRPPVVSTSSRRPPVVSTSSRRPPVVVTSTSSRPPASSASGSVPSSSTPAPTGSASGSTSSGSRPPFSGSSSSISSNFIISPSESATGGSSATGSATGTSATSDSGMIVMGGEIPGTADIDYPVLAAVPETNFSCRDQLIGGYYADVEARCQVFHVCHDYRKSSFLCPNGTLFDQQNFVCNWYFNVDCAISPQFFSLNERIGVVAERSDLTPAASSVQRPAAVWQQDVGYLTTDFLPPAALGEDEFFDYSYLPPAP